MKNNEYDAIIIGAGIGGLVCGCYLAKAGMKVLIVEKNAKPGGYCTSFERDEYFFDACVHSFGSIRRKGNIGKILYELGIRNELEIERHNPSDIIISPDYRVCFWNSLARTIKEFQRCFPGESKNITKFFQFIDRCEGVLFKNIKDITFEAFLNKYFEDTHLKAILALPILGNTSLPSFKVSAFRAITIYKEYILDGGYYPKEGIQKLPDLLLKRFQSYGGDFIPTAQASKININSNKVVGIEADGKGVFYSKYVISNTDAKQTYEKLIGKSRLNGQILNTLSQLTPSFSAFICYLGVKNNFIEKSSLSKFATVWYLPNYDIQSMYDLLLTNNIKDINWFLLHIIPKKNSLCVVFNAPFISQQYWIENKKEVLDLSIKKAEKLIPDLSHNLNYKEAATPYSLYKWTLNYKGACYGWAGAVNQFAITGLSQITPIKNLYLTGHWTTTLQGVPGVSYLGRDTANLIIKRNRMLLK